MILSITHIFIYTIFFNLIDIDVILIVFVQIRRYYMPSG
jgi:hypothetical protein